MTTTTVDFDARYRTFAAAFTSKVEAVHPDQWDLPSPCAEWSVRDLVTHVLTSEHDMLNPVHTEAPLSIDATLDPAGAWREVRDLIQDVLDDPDRAGLEYDGMFGTTTVGQTSTTSWLRPRRARLGPRPLDRAGRHDPRRRGRARPSP